MPLSNPFLSFLDPNSPLIAGFQQFVFNDWNFAAHLMVAIMVDTLCGIRASLILRNHSSFKLRDLFTKLIQYGAGLVSSNLLQQHMVHGQPNPVTAVVAPFFVGGIYVLMLWTEILSIDENLKRVPGGRGFLPSFISKRMAVFEETGRLETEALSEPTQDPTLS